MSGVPAGGWRMGPSAALPHLRPRRVLRQLTHPPRHQTLPQSPPSGHPVVRARRGLGLLLPRRSVRRRASRQARGDPAPALRPTGRVTSTISPATEARAIRHRDGHDTCVAFWWCHDTTVLLCPRDAEAAPTEFALAAAHPSAPALPCVPAGEDGAA